VIPSAVVCLELCVIIMENYTNSEILTEVQILPVVQSLRENGTFQPRSVDRGQERTSTSTRQLLVNFKVSQFVALLKSKGCIPIMFSGYKHCNQTIAFAGKSFVSDHLIFCE
jgi:hypothetical protein